MHLSAMADAAAPAATSAEFVVVYVTVPNEQVGEHAHGDWNGARPAEPHYGRAARSVLHHTLCWTACAADALAGSVVEASLAACVNILPAVTSVYRWEGKVNRDPELLLIIKTRK